MSACAAQIRGEFLYVVGEVVEVAESLQGGPVALEVVEGTGGLVEVVQHPLQLGDGVKDEIELVSLVGKLAQVRDPHRGSEVVEQACKLQQSVEAALLGATTACRCRLRGGYGCAIASSL